MLSSHWLPFCSGFWGIHQSQRAWLKFSTYPHLETLCKGFASHINDCFNVTGFPLEESNHLLHRAVLFRCHRQRRRLWMSQASVWVCIACFAMSQTKCNDVGKDWILLQAIPIRIRAVPCVCLSIHTQPMHFQECENRFLNFPCIGVYRYAIL